MLVGSKHFGIFAHDGVYHGHFECRNFLSTCFGFADISWEIVVNVQFIEDFFIYTIDTSDTLNDPCGIVGNIVIENSSCAVQVVSFRNGISGYQHFIIILL